MDTEIRKVMSLYTPRSGYIKNSITPACDDKYKFEIAEIIKMENERIKVYVGRRSMCAGDDMNVPNMKTFFLPDTLDAFAAKLHKLLPFDTWTCYLGHPAQNVADEEDGILVGSRRGSGILIMAVEPGDAGACNIVKYAANWQDLIKEHPYLYCE